MDGVDYGAWRFWWDVGFTVVLVVNTLYTWNVNRSKANRNAIDEQGRRITDVEADLRELRAEVKALPAHEDLGEIHEKVNVIGNSMAKIEGELTALNRNFALLFEDRLSQGARR